MNKLYFDTETTGLYERRQTDFFNYRKFPSLMSYSHLLVSDSGEEQFYDTLVKVPDDVEISEEAARVNGLTRNTCNTLGKSIAEVVGEFANACYHADLVVGYHIRFDLGIMEAAYYRCRANNIEVPVAPLPQIVDLAEYAEKLCLVPNDPKWAHRYPFKTPKLREAMRILCGEPDFQGHNSGADTKACYRLHTKIKEKLDEHRAQQAANSPKPTGTGVERTS